MKQKLLPPHNYEEYDHEGGWVGSVIINGGGIMRGGRGSGWEGSVIVEGGPGEWMGRGECDQEEGVLLLARSLSIES